MRFTVKAKVDDHTISAQVDTAQEALAKAIDWQIAKQLGNVVICEDLNVFSIAEFSEKLARTGGSAETLH